jgi:hypothetical protein
MSEHLGVMTRYRIVSLGGIKDYFNPVKLKWIKIIVIQDISDRL